MMRTSVSEAFMVPVNEIPRVIYHGIVLSVIISGFWLLDSLKDPILANTVGIEYQPMAKFFSVLATLIVVCVYDFFTSLVSKVTLFHLVSWTYGLIFMTISAVLSDPDWGLSQKERGPHRLIGWLSYFAVESYGSLMVALFWSVTNSVMDLEQAKGAYGLIVAITQIGAIIGSTVATSAAKNGIPQLFLVGSMTVFAVSLLMKAYCIVYRDHATESVMLRMSARLIEAKSSADSDPVTMMKDTFTRFFSGFYEGFILIIRYQYTMKILAISCLYEIVVTVLDYQFKVLGANSSSTELMIIDEGQFANLLGHFGQLTNLISLFISIFGFSVLVHRIGVKHSLLIFPSFLFLAVILVNFSPTLKVLFISVSIIKAIIFSLHDPIKELLYNPTSDAIKFKAKAWIDVFGSRLSKAAGSFITNLGTGDIDRLRTVSEIPCLIIALFILYIAWLTGDEFTHLVENHQIIGDERPYYYGDLPTLNLPERKGLKPGDVGYDGYDPHLFEGVFEDDGSSSKSESFSVSELGNSAKLAIPENDNSPKSIRRFHEILGSSPSKVDSPNRARSKSSNV